MYMNWSGVNYQGGIVSTFVFAQNLSQELGVNVVTIKQWSQWSPNLTVEQNREWIKSLQEQGYTIYDVGLDPEFTSRGNYDEGPFYSMELEEIFSIL